MSRHQTAPEETKWLLFSGKKYELLLKDLQRYAVKMISNTKHRVLNEDSKMRRSILIIFAFEVTTFLSNILQSTQEVMQFSVVSLHVKREQTIIVSKAERLHRPRSHHKTTQNCAEEIVTVKHICLWIEIMNLQADLTVLITDSVWRKMSNSTTVYDFRIPVIRGWINTGWAFKC